MSVGVNLQSLLIVLARLPKSNENIAPLMRGKIVFIDGFDKSCKERGYDEWPAPRTHFTADSFAVCAVRRISV